MNIRMVYLLDISNSTLHSHARSDMMECCVQGQTTAATLQSFDYFTDCEVILDVHDSTDWPRATLAA